MSGTTVMLGATGILVGAVFLNSIFFQTVLGYSALRAGVAFLPLALAIAAGTHLATRLLARVSPRTVAVAGLTLTGTGAVVLSAASGAARFAVDLLPGLLVLGAGVGMVFVAVAVTAMAGIPAQHAGMASGFLMTGHEIGAALGVAVLSAVAHHRGQPHQPGRNRGRLLPRIHRGGGRRGTLRRPGLRQAAVHPRRRWQRTQAHALIG
jgi:hypothetical protein